jgi:hypothetical protein
MSYVRPIPKSQIIKIEVADNDWETEVAYHERRGPGEEPRRWLSPMHPDAARPMRSCATTPLIGR